MITPMRMSVPTPKSMPWPTPQRPAQAAPVRRESFQPGGNPGGQECGGIHPAKYTKGVFNEGGSCDPDPQECRDRGWYWWYGLFCG